MELSDTTINILKNYATINPNIVIGEGNTIKTISVARNVMSKTEVVETFDSTIGIYDLNEFLGAVSLVKEPRFEVTKDYINISDSRRSVKYFLSDPEMLTSPGKDVNMPDTEVKFSLDTDTLSDLKKAASNFGYENISIKPSKGSVSLSVTDTDNATSNVFSIDVEGTYPEGADFNFILNVNNLKVVNEDYDVEISSKLISHFTSKQSPTEYFIALEKSSTYNGA